MDLVNWSMEIMIIMKANSKKMWFKVLVNITIETTCGKEIGKMAIFRVKANKSLLRKV